MSPTRSATGRRTPPQTKWGDKEQRRVDILDAARGLIADRGYLALSMRDIAADAGISPATLYSYFATKEELFATLYVEAIDAHTDRIEPVCTTASDITELLQALLAAYVDLYGVYGRHFTVWSSLRADTDVEAAMAAGTDGGATDGFPLELIKALRLATRRYGRLVRHALRRVAAESGQHLVDDHLSMVLLWMTQTGLADHLTSERRAFDRFDPSALIDFTAARLAVALVEPEPA